MRYDEGFGENLLSQLRDEANVDEKFLQRAGAPPFVKKNSSILNVDAHFIVRVRALNKNTNLDLAIYNVKQPLLVKAERRVTMVLAENTEQVYEAKVGYDMQEADVDVKLEFGELEVAISFTPEFTETHTLKDAI